MSHSTSDKIRLYNASKSTIINPATEEKQLPDNHQVTVSNPTANPETGLATSVKQDTLLTELQKKADLTETQPNYDEGNNFLLREILKSNVIPLWFDPTTGCLKMTGSGQTFSTVTTVTTVGTVTVVTGQTNIGGIPADPMVPNMINQTWALGIRTLLT